MLSGGTYADVGGSGTTSSLGVPKLSVDVRSPATARRHAVMLGSTMPKRASMKRMSDVWSKTCELTYPPLLHGEMTIIGTRTPRPMGPASKLELPAKTSLVVSTVERPFARDTGGVGGT